MRAGQVADSFVARIWLERRSNGDPVWRGHIHHVQSGQERYFGNLGEMRDFMEHLTGVPCAASRPGERNDAAIS
jgi:hypothetical protein